MLHIQRKELPLWDAVIKWSLIKVMGFEPDLEEYAFLLLNTMPNKMNISKISVTIIFR